MIRSTALLVVCLTAIFTSCTIEEEEASTYSSTYECNEGNVVMFKMDGEQVLRVGKSSNPLSSGNHVEVTDSGVFVTVFFWIELERFRLNLNFYTDETPSTCGPERSGDGTLLKVFSDGRYRFYSHDCFSNAAFYLRNYDKEKQTACGHFSLTVTSPLDNHHITQGYFTFE
jgi:hypothetical protein